MLEAGWETARAWGHLCAEGKRRGRTHPQNDGWIAACCLTEDLPLATLNTKDF
jgi:predicted nucleic acid-binding protein